jgi:hypothetical protein
MKEKNKKTFDCTKCGYIFLGVESFHGEYLIPHGEVRDVKLCSKCLAETDSLWSGETKTIVRQIEEKIEYLTRRHAIDRNPLRGIRFSSNTTRRHVSPTSSWSLYKIIGNRKT